MKSQFLGAAMAVICALGDVALSLPVGNAQVRHHDRSDDDPDGFQNASKAYYYRQGGRVTFDHARVHYVDTIRDELTR